MTEINKLILDSDSREVSIWKLDELVAWFEEGSDLRKKADQLVQNIKERTELAEWKKIKEVVLLEMSKWTDPLMKKTFDSWLNQLLKQRLHEQIEKYLSDRESQLWISTRPITSEDERPPLPESTNDI